jgi:dihydrofolate reductase
MKISMIVAHGPNREIGLLNKLLWHHSDDLKHFKKVTSGKIILMGRKTFESIGKPLPNRTNIILTRDIGLKSEGVEVITNPEMIFDYVLEKENDDLELELVICGGEEIYKIYLPYVQTLHRTLVEFNGAADAYFPQINENEWTILKEEKYPGFIIQELERK